MHMDIINGPNLHLLGKRIPAIYGAISFDVFFHQLKKKFTYIDFSYFQSNIEGKLVDQLHKISLKEHPQQGIILNAGAYTHTSIALADAVQSISIPVVDVHISNLYTREPYRKINRIAPYCQGSIIGFGLSSYTLAVYALLSFFSEKMSK